MRFFSAIVARRTVHARVVSVDVATNATKIQRCGGKNIDVQAVAVQMAELHRAQISKSFLTDDVKEAQLKNLKVS